MKRRGTVVDFPCHSGLDDSEKSPSFHPSHRRSRTLSQFSVSSQSSKVTLDLSKIPPTSTMGSYNASGSFSPTPSASASLLALDPSFSREQPSLDHIQRKTLPALFCDRDGTESPTPQSPEMGSPDTPGPPLSTKSSLSSVPSISRTSSSFSDSNVLPTTPSRTQSKAPSPKAKGRCNKLHPILAACEKMSKVSSQAVCATCMKRGYDYPRCAKCGEMWCSRGCRLRGGVKRHVCSRTGI